MTNVLSAIISITRFDKGEADKIFSEVKKSGTQVVIKNDVPECILMSPQNYQKIMEELENALLFAEAERRLSENISPISHSDIMKKYGVSESELKITDVELE